MSDRSSGNPSARRAHVGGPGPAANDEAPAAAEYLSGTPGPADDPCAEAGYDELCRDAAGQSCPFHEQHCRPPDFPCVELLRHTAAVGFLEELSLLRRARHPGPPGTAQTRSTARSRASWRTSSTNSGATPPPPTMLTTLPGAALQTEPPSPTPESSEA